jgi:hypothetical protein
VAGALNTAATNIAMNVMLKNLFGSKDVIANPPSW